MKIGSFEFNMRELAGSMGDFGTLLPLAIGYIAVCGLDPSGFLVMMGLTNIALALVYKLPMPLEPKKVLAVMAIAQRWTPSMIYASGFGLGVIWLFLAITGLIGKLVKITPRCVTRGIQLFKFGRDIRINKELVPTIATVGVSLVTNMAGGYLCGLAVYHGIRLIVRARGR